MNSATWRPVTSGTIECGCGETCGCSLTVEGVDTITLENEAGYWSTVLPPGVRLCERVEDALITPDALEAAGWEYMQWNGVVDEWYKQFAPPTMGHSNCVGVRFKERRDEPPDLPKIYLFLSNSHVHVPGCRTMSQLAALVSMLTG